MLQGPPTSGLGLGKNYSLAVTGMMVTIYQTPPAVAHLLANHRKSWDLKERHFFCELGQLDSEVMGHSSASRGSPRNCLVFLTMSSLSGELKSILGSHHSGQSQSERALIHREPQSHH